MLWGLEAANPKFGSGWTEFGKRGGEKESQEFP